MLFTLPIILVVYVGFSWSDYDTQKKFETMVMYNFGCKLGAVSLEAEGYNAKENALYKIQG